eukprot:2299482-Pleurochrysis_carterae.AAC.1
MQDECDQRCFAHLRPVGRRDERSVRVGLEAVEAPQKHGEHPPACLSTVGSHARLRTTGNHARLNTMGSQARLNGVGSQARLKASS